MSYVPTIKPVENTRRFSLGMLGLNEKLTMSKLRRSSLASTCASKLQGAKQHEQGDRRSHQATPPSSLRNRFKKFYTHSLSTRSTASIQTCEDTYQPKKSSMHSTESQKLDEKMSHGYWQPEFPDVSIHLTCPHCNKQVQSITRRVNGRLIWISSFLLLLSTIVCACVPCCIPWLKDVQHFCPECHARVGKHRRW